MSTHKIQTHMELDFMILMAPFQLRRFHDSMVTGGMDEQTCTAGSQIEEWIIIILQGISPPMLHSPAAYELESTGSCTRNYGSTEGDQLLWKHPNAPTLWQHLLSCATWWSLVILALTHIAL